MADLGLTIDPNDWSGDVDRAASAHRIDGNFQTALAFAAAGISVFPCSAANRTPLVKWRDQSTSDGAAITRMWLRNKSALVGIDLGKCGLVVIDLDRHEGASDGVAAFREILGVEPETFGCPVTRTPRLGLHLIFRQPEGPPLGNSPGAFKGCGIDVRGHGGFVFAPGSTRPDGSGWTPILGTPDLIDAFKEGLIPVLPERLATLIRSRPARDAPILSEAQPAPRFEAPGNQREHAYAAKALAENAAELSATGKGGRNHALNAFAYRMGRMVARSWVARERVIRELTDACQANGLLRDDGPRAVSATIASGLRAGTARPHEDLPRGESPDDSAAIRIGDAIAARLIAMEDGSLVNEETGEVVHNATAATAQSKSESFPDHLTHVPGLMGELVEWIRATARRPSRALALAASVVVLGTVCGRYWCGPTNAGTHFYVAMLAPTGAGKDHYLQAPRKLLRAINLFDCIGPDEFMSQTAIQSHVARHPLSLCPMDEIGAFLRRVQGKRASSFETGISKTLRSLWGINYGETSTAGYAQRRAEPLYATAMTILGASTQEEFWSALEGADINNGFLNRFLMFTLDDRPKAVKPVIDQFADAPAKIVAGLRALHAGGNVHVSSSQCCSADAVFKPVRVEWETPDAEQSWVEYEEGVVERHGKDKERMPYYARTAENALRLATVRALGRMQPGEPTVSASDVAWGIAVVEWSAKAMMRGAGLYLSETEAQANANRVLRIIGEANGACSRRSILMRMKHRLKPRDLEDVLRSLEDSGAVIKEDVRTAGGGRPSRYYRLGAIG